MPSVAFSEAVVKTDHALAVCLTECKMQPWAFLALLKCQQKMQMQDIDSPLGQRLKRNRE